MSGYIKEKCLEIEIHAKRLYEREDFTGLGMEQEYSWVRQALDVIRNQAEGMAERIRAIMEIETALVEGGESEFIVQRVTKILEESNRKMGIEGLRKPVRP